MAQTRRAAARRSFVLVVGLVLLAGSARAQVADELPVQDPPSTGATSALDSAAPVASSPSFWTRRHIGLIAGFGASFAAATIAWLRDRDLQARKQAIQALPPGAPDIWSQQVADASNVLTARDFWRDTAIGIGGFTLACVALSPSRDARQIAPLPDRLQAPSGRRWLASIHVATPAISITRVF